MQEHMWLKFFTTKCVVRNERLGGFKKLPNLYAFGARESSEAPYSFNYPFYFLLNKNMLQKILCGTNRIKLCEVVQESNAIMLY